MAAALTIAVILMLSVAVARVAAVAMRHTGLPENVARFQCISALTGTGFTTSESEMILNYPIRRRILVVLMVLGNLGLVTIAATFIVSFVETGSQPNAVLRQAFLIAAATAVTLFVMTNKTVDQFLCDLIGGVLEKTTSLRKRSFQRLVQIGNGFSIGEHTFTGSKPVALKDLPLETHELTVLASRGSDSRHHHPVPDEAMVSPGDVLVCYGHDGSHEAFEEHLSGRGKPAAQ